jgi:opacity protein-like surface antigen
MAISKPANFANLVGASRTASAESGTLLDQLMPAPSSGKAPVKKSVRSAVRNELPQGHELAQRGNGPVMKGYGRGSTGGMSPNQQVPQRMPVAPQARPNVPQLQRSKSNLNVNVTNISESNKLGSTNNGLKVTVSEKRTLNQILTLNSALSVQGNNGTKGTKSTSSTTIGASVELVGKVPTGRKDETFTGKAFVAGEITNSPNSPNVVKGKLGVSGRVDRQIDKTTSVYGSAGAELAIANNNSPVTTLAAQVGLDKTISADGKLKLNVNAGLEQPLGGLAEVSAGGKLSYKVDSNISLIGEIKVTNFKTEAKLGIGIGG